MRSHFKKFRYLALIVCLVSLKGFNAFAEESKSFFSWDSSFIKKADPNKKKGIPANPPKKKLKGIPSQSTNNSVNNELTAEEKKTVQAMTNSVSVRNAASPLKNTARSPIVRVPIIPKVFKVPQTPKVPKNPNLYNIRIPSPPTAFSSNSNSNNKPEAPTSPSKQAS